MKCSRFVILLAVVACDPPLPPPNRARPSDGARTNTGDSAQGDSAQGDSAQGDTHVPHGDAALEGDSAEDRGDSNPGDARAGDPLLPGDDARGDTRSPSDHDLGGDTLGGGDPGATPATDLFGPNPDQFSNSSRVVSTTFFHWFTTNGGQKVGPWRPYEGRAAWDGGTEFWKNQLKQVMRANIDVLWVHLIPEYETQRINFFRAYFEMRQSGYAVPAIAPFLDPVITWGSPPYPDAATSQGKDTYVAQYVRFFQQYFSENADPDAESYIATIGNRVVLDLWHPHLNITNYGSLTRADISSRLVASFPGRAVFANGIYQVTTGINPTLAFADERVPQFETHEYYRAVTHNSVTSVQLKPGYWDQNIRVPGFLLPRSGGSHYASAWAQVDRNTVQRVYVESWNEYDEGSGIYRGDPGPPYLQGGNTGSDTWSSSNNPWQYVETTAEGARAFNDTSDYDAEILFHQLPAQMRAGHAASVQVIVRNAGDVGWIDAALHRFGQKLPDSDANFSATGFARWLLDDSDNEVPTYGSVFRGRPATFMLDLKAPSTPGSYFTRWGMLQEGSHWFGETIDVTIEVVP